MQNNSETYQGFGCKSSNAFYGTHEDFLNNDHFIIVSLELLQYAAQFGRVIRKGLAFVCKNPFLDSAQEVISLNPRASPRMNVRLGF